MTFSYGDDALLPYLAKVTAQYKEAKKLKSYLSALLQFSQEIKEAFIEMQRQTRMDEAEGKQLDTLGAILGLTRTLSRPSVGEYFGFSDMKHAHKFGEEADAHAGILSMGGCFYEEKDSLAQKRELSDEIFKKCLHARVIRNQMRGTNEEIISLIRCFIPAPTPVLMDDHGCMAVWVSFPVLFTASVLEFLNGVDILPRLAGVKLGFGVHFRPGHTFGFGDASGSKGFSEEGEKVPYTGGRFAEQISPNWT